MNSEGRFHADEVAELESHLCESVYHLVESGLDSDEAFLVAVHRLGTAQALEVAYDENRTLIDYLLRPSRSVATLGLIIVLLAIGWMTWNVYPIAMMFGEADTMIVMARQGAEVRVASDGLYVEAGEAGMVSHSIASALALPFGLLSLLAFLGWVAVWHRSSAPEMAT